MSEQKLEVLEVPYTLPTEDFKESGEQPKELSLDFVEMVADKAAKTKQNPAHLRELRRKSSGITSEEQAVVAKGLPSEVLIDELKERIAHYEKLIAEYRKLSKQVY